MMDTMRRSSRPRHALPRAHRMLAWAAVAAVAANTVLPAHQLTAQAASVASSAPVSLALRSGTAVFSASATLGGFSGTTGRLSGEVSSTAGLSQARGWVAVQLDSLSTDNGRRDGHMREALEVEAFPEARFELDSVRTVAGSAERTELNGTLRARAGEAPGLDELLREPLLPPAESEQVLLFGRFTVHGVSKPVTAMGAVQEAPSGAWTLVALFPVTLAEHEISKGLSRMFGTIKVRPVVGVQIRATFAPR